MFSNFKRQRMKGLLFVRRSNRNEVNIDLSIFVLEMCCAIWKNIVADIS